MVRFTSTTRLLSSSAMGLALTIKQTSNVYPCLMFFSYGIPRLTYGSNLPSGTNRLLLIVSVLILLLGTRRNKFPQAITNARGRVPPRDKRQLAVIQVIVFLCLLIPILIMRPATPASRICKVIVRRLGLTMRFNSIITYNHANIRCLMFRTTRRARSVPYAL